MSSLTPSHFSSLIFEDPECEVWEQLVVRIQIATHQLYTGLPPPDELVCKRTCSSVEISPFLFGVKELKCSFIVNNIIIGNNFI